MAGQKLPCKEDRRTFYLGPYWSHCPLPSNERSRELDEPHKNLLPVLWLFVFMLALLLGAEGTAALSVSFCWQT